MDEKKRDLRLVVLHRGWMVVGEYWADFDQAIVTHCSILRRVRHEDGVGGACKTPGKASLLKLDPTNDLKTHPLQILFTIELSDDWEDLLR